MQFPLFFVAMKWNLGTIGRDVKDILFDVGYMSLLCEEHSTVSTLFQIATHDYESVTTE